MKKKQQHSLREKFSKFNKTINEHHIVCLKQTYIAHRHTDIIGVQEMFHNTALHDQQYRSVETTRARFSKNLRTNLGKT